MTPGLSRSSVRLRVLVFITLAAVPAAGSPDAPSTTTTPPADIATVMLDGEPLFEIRTSLGPFFAVERAAAVTARIGRLVKDPTITLDSIALYTKLSGGGCLRHIGREGQVGQPDV